jgi:AcrR family transcriptional regulator
MAAARRLLTARGYAATTMQAVADEAGVSVETIYGAFGSKAGLTRDALRLTLRGDDEPVALKDRAPILAIRAEPDPHRQLALYAAFLPGANARIAPLVRVLWAGAQTDAELAEVLAEHDRDRLESMDAFAHLLAERGGLRAGITVAGARDVLWGLNSVELFDLLVVRSGWSHERYGAWLAETLAAALLPGAPGGATSRPESDPA